MQYALTKYYIGNPVGSKTKLKIHPYLYFPPKVQTPYSHGQRRKKIRPKFQIIFSTLNFVETLIDFL